MLGKLEDVVNMTATMRPTADIVVSRKDQTRVWTLLNTSAVQYPNVVTIVQGDVVVLPAFTTEISKNVYSL